MRLGWIYDPQFLRHDPGGGHVEQRGRLEVILEALHDAGIQDQLDPLPFRPATPQDLALVHDPAYIEIVRMMCEQGFTFIGAPDTGIGPESYHVAALASGGVIAACQAVWHGRMARAFCAVRPPGHHAHVDQAMGFCLFNHVAIGAEYLVERCGARRIAIVDFDAHHGNGTQHFFAARRDVLYVSLHERPGSLAFPGTGEADERGCGEGTGFTLNLPLRPGSGLEEYLQVIAQELDPAVDQYQPEILLLSAGFDALMWDRLSHLSLEPASFGPITEALVALADRHAQGRVVSVLEGGYDLGQLGQAVLAHVRALLPKERAGVLGRPG